jgi:hypothetical protein
MKINPMWFEEVVGSKTNPLWLENNHPIFHRLFFFFFPQSNNGKHFIFAPLFSFLLVFFPTKRTLREH